MAVTLSATSKSFSKSLRKISNDRTKCNLVLGG
jgi:hypothetical protein